VPELTVASTLAYLLPAVCFEDRNHLVNLLGHIFPLRPGGPIGTRAAKEAFSAPRRIDLTMADAWVYMLRCSDGSLYTGWSTDVSRRVARHRAGKASRYTASRLPVELAFLAPMSDRGAARREEARIKRLDRAAKLALIDGL
jgi:putative endonuclease